MPVVIKIPCHEIDKLLSNQEDTNENKDMFGNTTECDDFYRKSVMVVCLLVSFGRRRGVACIEIGKCHFVNQRFVGDLSSETVEGRLQGMDR